MAIQIRNGSAWSTIRNISSYNSGTSSWVTSANAAIWDGGSWVGFLDKVRLVTKNVQTQASDNGFGTGTLTWGLNASTGNFTGVGIPDGKWCQNTNNTDLYEVEATVSSGAGTVGGPTGANNWSSLSTTRSWSITNSANPGSDADAIFTVSIRNIVSQEVVAGPTTVNLRIIGIR